MSKAELTLDHPDLPREFKKPRHDAVPGFTFIAPSIYEYFPPKILTPQWTEVQLLPQPDLILVFSWTGAHGRHVQKYTDSYQALFPTSPVLVITTSVIDLAFRSSSSKQERLLPAIRRVLSYGFLSKVLIHAFSEGGSHKSVEFVEAYYKYTGSRLPCSALCLDSTPGHPRFRRLVNAVKLSLPPYPILRASGILVGGIVLGTIWTITIGFKGGKQNSLIGKTRRRLVDDKHWDLDAPRCYLYSKNDTIIDWTDIKQHAKESKQKGLNIVEIMFEESDHCKHSTEDESAYWGAVNTTWKQASTPKGAWRQSRYLREMQSFDFGTKSPKSSDESSDRTLWEV